MPDSTRVCRYANCDREVARATQARYCSDACRGQERLLRRRAADPDYLRRWKRDNAEHVRKYKATRRRDRSAEARERDREYSRRYNDAHRERLREQQNARRRGRSHERNRKDRERYAANIESRREYNRRYYAANRDRILEQSKRWKRDRRAEVAKVRRREMRVRQLTVVFFTPEQVEQRMAHYGSRCWMCGGEYESIDHVKPISKGGPHILANLRPSCKDCNRRKAARWYGVAELHRFKR